MKRSLILAVILLFLGGLAYFFTQKTKKDPLEIQHKLFAVEDTSAIGKVFIADKKGNKALLINKGDHWVYINPDKGVEFRANQGMINLLKQSISKLRVRMKANQNAIPTIIRQMVIDGFKVEVYDRSGGNMKTFYIGNETANDTGCYGMLENDEQPYIIYIEGHVGILKPRFTPYEDWKTTYIMYTPPSKIQKVELTYQDTAYSKLSFVINKEGSGRYSLKSPDGRNLGEPNAEFVADYLKALNAFEVEAVLSDKDVARDSIVMFSTQFCTFKITDDQGKVQTIEAKPIGKEANDYGDGRKTIRGDTPRFILIENNGKQYYTAQQAVISKIMVQWGYFLEAPATSK